MKFNYIEQKLSNGFYKYAKFVSKWPLFFLLFPLVITVVLLLGCVWFLHFLPDNLNLYTPNDGQSVGEERLLTNLFPIDETSPYYIERRHDSERLGYILVTCKPAGGESVLAPHILNETLQLWQRVRSLHIWEAGIWLSLKALCLHLPHTNTCVENPLLDLFQDNSSLLHQLKYPQWDNAIYTGGLLGGVSLNETSQAVLRAKAILLPYQLHHASNRANSRAKAWELRLSAFLSRFRSNLISVRWWTSETLAVEAHRDTQTLLRLLGPLFGLVTLFTVMCCLVGDWVRSKPFLGFGGVISASCAIVSAIGLLSYCGVMFTSVAYFMPFIVFCKFPVI